MSLETAIKSVIDDKMQDGTVERLVAENFEKGVNKALESLVGGWGDVTKVIEKKIKEVMVARLETYDYSEYIIKLDCVLTEILKNTALDHKEMLKNFKELMVDAEFPKVVKVSDIFEEWKKHVAKNVDTSDLDVEFDSEPSYQLVNVTMEVEREEKRSWSDSSFEYAKLIFECEEDEEMNIEMRLSKFLKYPWSLSAEIDTSLNSLRHLDKFKIYLLKLKQSGADIEIDMEGDSDEVQPEKEPEPDYR